jgi:hypothetical protein
LGDLALQTSSYGTPIPKMYGAMRAAGTVIWATDLRETRASSGGGKGRPKSVSYSYSASFAVALSARPIRAVSRIWADGKLLRGAAGDFKTETKFRLHLGSEDQAADPMIAAAEGAGGTPAYRGLAYAVFEDMQLAEYGNRIPSLSFEIEADEGPVSIGSIAEQLSGGVLVAGNSPDLIGYAAGGDGVRSAIESLSAFVPLSLVAQGDRLLITRPAGPEASLDLAESGARPGSEGGSRDEQARQAAATVPNSVAIAFADPVRDFQAGLQRAFRGGAGLVAEQHALPAAVTAVQAKALAEARLASLWAGRTSASLHLPSRAANVRPGELVRIEGQTGLWRVERWMLEAMVVKLQLVRVPASAAAPMDASSGRPLGERDLRHGPTILRLIELPSDGETASDRPRLLVAAAGELPGWRRAALMLSLDRGASWQELGGTAAPAVIGKTQTALPPAGSALLDDRHAIIVQLGHDEMWLQSATDPALANGANLALIGDELIQFGAAEPIGNNRFRLSRLLRGRLGTEWRHRLIGRETPSYAGSRVAACDRSAGHSGRGRSTRFGKRPW